MNTRLRAIFLTLLFMFGMLVSVSVGAGLYFFFEPPFLSYRELPFPTKFPAVRRGEVMPILVTRCSTADSTRTYGIAHKFVPVGWDGVEVTMKAEFASIEPGCGPTWSEINQTSKTMQPGTYRIVGVSDAKGTVRNYAVEWWSVPFEVLP